jgi:4-diphosphocytidyl-2-C-methyl-D-erythritol kinase
MSFELKVMKELKLKALAKINLGLDVVRKRDDGYHEVRMVMQTLHLHDTVTMTEQKTDKITVSTNLYYLPTDQGNLAYRAAQILKDEFKIRQGVVIDIVKRIPVAAGMAGGSTDAAAVLVGMNRMFRLGLSTKELMERAVHLGADVPYCVMRGTALAEGIGEELTALAPAPKCPVLIAKPSVSVSTQSAYGRLDLDTMQHPDIDAIISDIEQKDLNALASHMDNVFEPGTIKQYPVIGQLEDMMMEHHALRAMMTGSGPTVFGLFEQAEDAKEACRVIRESKLAQKVCLTSIYNRYR